MKHTFKYILIGLSLLGIAMTANAQMAYNRSDEGITTGKQVAGPFESEDLGAYYTITLETYAEGESDYSEKASDIVLVLDISGSMKEPYIPTESKTWTANDINNSEIDLYYREWNSSQNWFDYYGPLYVTTTGYGFNQRQVFRGSKVAGGSGTKDLEIPYTGVLYHDVKLDAMKAGVKAFIDIVNDNDRYQADGQTLRSTRLGNRIAIVTYSTNSEYLLTGWTRLGNNAGSVNNNTGYTNLNNAVDRISASGSTNVNLGMSTAQTLMNSATGIKTVVMFTDGIPGNGSWAGTGMDVADSAIETANSIKGNDGKKATIWTVGIFEEMSDSDKANTNKYMSRVSSNYLGVTDMATSATAVDTKYYIEATAGSNLSQIFADIASASTDHPTVDASTQVKDVLASSFSLPEGTKPSDIRLYTSNYTNNQTWATRQTAPSTVTPSITSMQKLDENGQPVFDEEGEPVMLSTVQVTNYDFTSNDSTPTSYDGHWVGPRTVQGVTRYAGQKLIIEFDIVAADGITGGVGTNTNTSQSGVYVKQKDGSYENVNEFVIPHTTLPITLKIKKSGLRHGESATFEIERCRPKNWDETKTLAENIAAMEYNGLGKPIPSKADNAEWDNWTKVIITNKGDNGDPVEKTLIALDPYYVYKISEDTWSWSYDAISTAGQSHENTSTVEINPFNFRNQLKTGDNIPKHAEAVTINHFNYEISTGKQEEHYKSSKDEFQTNPTNTTNPTTE